MLACKTEAKAVQRLIAQNHQEAKRVAADPFIIGGRFTGIGRRQRDARMHLRTFQGRAVYE